MQRQLLDYTNFLQVVREECCECDTVWDRYRDRDTTTADGRPEPPETPGFLRGWRPWACKRQDEMLMIRRSTEKTVRLMAVLFRVKIVWPVEALKTRVHNINVFLANNLDDDGYDSDEYAAEVLR